MQHGGMILAPLALIPVTHRCCCPRRMLKKTAAPKHPKPNPTQGELLPQRLQVPRLAVKREWYVGINPDPIDHSHPDVGMGFNFSASADASNLHDREAVPHGSVPHPHQQQQHAGGAAARRRRALLSAPDLSTGGRRSLLQAAAGAPGVESDPKHQPLTQEALDSFDVFSMDPPPADIGTTPQEQQQQSSDHLADSTGGEVDPDSDPYVYTYNAEDHEGGHAAYDELGDRWEAAEAGVGTNSGGMDAELGGGASQGGWDGAGQQAAASQAHRHSGGGVEGGWADIPQWGDETFTQVCRGGLMCKIT